MTDRQAAKGLVDRLARQWAELMKGGDDAPESREVAAAAAAEAPVVWLIGKVQSGKSSIVRAITGADEAEIGTGFRPCTRTARVFDFPPGAPVVRFLDTRGLGEAGYDPAEDLAFAEENAHLLLVVMRALDSQQDEVLQTVAAVRKRKPGWPVVVAQTCLHDGYAHGDGHVLPYPFGENGEPGADARLTPELTRSLAHQRSIVRASLGNDPALRFVPIDFTHPDDGFAPRLYGLDALMEAITGAAPASIRAALDEMGGAAADRAVAGARSLILGHATAAAAADLVPLAGAVAVPGVQARLLHALAARRGVEWDRRLLGEFGACLGASILTRFAARFGIRQIVKLVPVYGQTIGAAAAAATSFATTYALGRAALEFLRRRERGSVDPDAIAAAYREGLEKAFAIARDRGFGDGGSPGKTTDAG